MKIGILTFHDTHNFGACLQAWSLSEVIRGWGYEVEFINYHNSYLNSADIVPTRKPTFYIRNPKRFVKAILVEGPIRRKYCNLKKILFQKNTLSKPVTKKNINDVLLDKDVLIIGSDQVWNFQINGNDYTFFGKNIDERVLCLTYGVSAGILWNHEQKKEVLQYIGRFQQFLVREQSLADQLYHMINEKKPIYVVADPTMLIPQKRWKMIGGRKSEYSFGKYVLIYFYSDKLRQYAKWYAEKYNFELVEINYGLRRHRAYHKVKPEKVEQWLWLIDHAEALFTSSYHGTLFSLYLHTNFYVDDSKNQERFKSLLAEFDLEDRIIHSNFNESEKIQWESVDEKINEMRMNSLSCLSGLLHEVEE